MRGFYWMLSGLVGERGLWGNTPLIKIFAPVLSSLQTPASNKINGLTGKPTDSRIFLEAAEPQIGE